MNRNERKALTDAFRYSRPVPTAEIRASAGCAFSNGTKSFRCDSPRGLKALSQQFGDGIDSQELKRAYCGSANPVDCPAFIDLNKSGAKSTFASATI